MPRRHPLPHLTLCLALFATACANSPSGSVPALESLPAADPQGGLVANNAGTLVANNAGTLVSNNAGTLVSNNTAGLVADNAGSLVGVIQGPAAGLIANNASNLVSNNTGNLVGNNTSNLVGRATAQLAPGSLAAWSTANAARFGLLALDAYVAPAAQATVAVYDAAGNQLSNGSVTTDARGAYRIDHMRPSLPVVFVRATYHLEGRDLSLSAAAPAPRSIDAVQASVDPATTLVAKKLTMMVASKALDETRMRAGTIDRLSAQVGSALDAKAVAAAAVLDGAGAASAFDDLAMRTPALAEGLGAIAQEAAAPRDPIGPATPSNVSTVAGGLPGMQDGAAASARFQYPYGIAAAADGTLYVADYRNFAIRRIAADGTVSRLAGDGTAGYADGPGPRARFSNPRGLAIDAHGTLYVVDGGRIRAVASDGTVSTVAGDGNSGMVDGPGAQSEFADPRGIAVDAQGNLFVADTGNLRVRRVASDGTTSTLAVTAPEVPNPAAAGGMQGPYGVAVDAGGRVYVADASSNRILAIAPSGEVRPYAGSGAQGAADGAALQASFRSPVGLSLDDKGTLYVSDFYNHAIRTVSADGRVTTLAGNGQPGSRDGGPDAAQFYGPYGLFAGAHAVYIADTSNHRIRRVALP